MRFTGHLALLLSLAGCSKAAPEASATAGATHSHRELMQPLLLDGLELEVDECMTQGGKVDACRTQKALAAKDGELCFEIMNTAVAIDCLRRVGEEPGGSPPTAAQCKRFGHRHWSFCQQVRAIAESNPEICSEDTDSSARCFEEYARAKGDVEVCERLSYEPARGRCVSKLAESLGPSVCHRLRGQYVASCAQRAVVGEYGRERVEAAQRVEVGKKAASLCRLDPAGRGRDSCLLHVARFARDVSLCEGSSKLAHCVQFVPEPLDCDSLAPGELKDACLIQRVTSGRSRAATAQEIRKQYSSSWHYCRQVSGSEARDHCRELFELVPK